MACVALVFACLGFGTVLATLWEVSLEPSDWANWVGLAVGLGVGGWVGTLFGSNFVQMLLVCLRPSCLEADGALLRIRVWKLWSGDGTRGRTHASASLHEFKGVAIGAGQGGWRFDTNLFLIHSSGLLIGTGWSGRRTAAVELGKRLTGWLATDHGRR